MWYEATVSHLAMNENGKERKVTERYLVDAESVTDAEGKVTDAVSPYFGDFECKCVREVPFSEVFRGEREDDNFYAARVALVTLDEKTGEEKKTVCPMLVNAEGFDDAVKRLHEGMKGTMSDYEVVSVALSPIIGIIEDQDNG